MFSSSVNSYCEQRKYYLKKIYKNKNKNKNRPATVISTDSNFPLCKGKDKLSISFIRMTNDDNLTRIDHLHTRKIGYKLQFYPVNLALNVSSITLLFISSRIILDNENNSEFREASSLPDTEVIRRDPRWPPGTPSSHVMLVSFRVPHFLPLFFSFYSFTRIFRLIFPKRKELRITSDATIFSGKLFQLNIETS